MSMLRSVVVSVGELVPEIRREMFALFEHYYQAISPIRFEEDLAHKDAVFLLRDDGNRLRGFSTLAIWPMEIAGASIRVIFSGDTVIDRSHWGSQAFAFSWIRQIGRIAADSPDLPLYWLLIVKGHRTYRYLPAFGLDFVPNWRKSDQQTLVEMKDAIAERRFGTAYDRKTGIIRFKQSRGHLAPEWAAVTPREAARPDVRFFLERNPGYVVGDELVCLCELSPKNMRPLTRRLFLQGASQ